MAAAEHIQVVVAHAPREGVVELQDLQLPAGSTLQEALQACGKLSQAGLVPDGLKVGIWGKVRELSHVLRDRDRVELYRGLLVDPKEARRQRYQQHKARLAARQR